MAEFHSCLSFRAPVLFMLTHCHDSLAHLRGLCYQKHLCFSCSAVSKCLLVKQQTLYPNSCVKKKAQM